LVEPANTYGIPLGFPPVVALLVSELVSLAAELWLVAPPPLVLAVVSGLVVALVLLLAPFELVTALVAGDVVPLLACVALLTFVAPVLLAVAGELVSELDELSEESS
jgi:hypothetical protein